MASAVSFHEEADAELEIAFEWYYLRSEFVASRFAEELSKAIAMISEAPKRWPIAASWRTEIPPSPFSFCGCLSRGSIGDSSSRRGAWASKTWLLEEEALGNDKFVAISAQFPLFHFTQRA